MHRSDLAAEPAAHPSQPAPPLQQLAQRFIAKVESRRAIVGVLGLGYVGLPLALAFHHAGFPIIGFDRDERKIDRLRAGRTYIRHITDEKIAELNESGRFIATARIGAVAAEVDAIVICVPTPLTRHREPDMTYVEGTARAIAPHLRPGQLVVLESTTYPCTSEELLKLILENGSGLQADRDFAMAYSPEREDPGNPDFATAAIPKVVGADDELAADMACALYGAVTGQVVRVDSMRAAEAVKLTENIFRAVNIALVNELKVVFSRMGIDIWEVIEAAKTKPFGYMPFYPGPGLGGHCIPIDPFYLSWKAREYGLSARFIELAGEVNTHMPHYVVQELVDALSQMLKKPINGAKILIVGLAYKKNVDDMRESPAMTIMELLESRGALADYYDPYIPEIGESRKHMALAGRRSIEPSGELLRQYDAALIATDHDNVDLQPVLQEIPVIVDTRNATRGYPRFAHKVRRA